MKLDEDGNELWAETSGGMFNGNDYAYGMGVSSNGDVYVTGAGLISLDLAIDDTGSPTANGIIEPDNPVDLVGTVYNASYAYALGATGLISSSDPIVINTGTATYPTNISPGANATCIACYNITAPLSNRPSTHWDIMVTDTISCTNCTSVDEDYSFHIGNSFSDVPPSQIFYSHIEKLLHSGITSGCTTSTYCPSANVQRQHLAKFVCTAMQTASPGSCTLGTYLGIFADVPASNPFCGYIEALYNAGVISGCGPSLFCPEQYLARDQMAKILVNAFGLHL